MDTIRSTALRERGLHGLNVEEGRGARTREPGVKPCRLRGLSVSLFKLGSFSSVGLAPLLRQ